MATPAAKGKITLKLLLIIVMVIQPVLVSYAMAGMLDSHHQALAVAGQAGEGSIANSDASAPAHYAGWVQNDNPINESGVDGDSNTNGDCCNSAQCCPAAVVDVDVLLHAQNPIFFTPFLLSWEGVSLSTEIRPPRSLLG